ncbi:hypothetical protein [Altericista sp. CCNU0014]|uniref:hypothetical protein n=1 Tax=Altericista sp. CCNU0014 TaxID=3082949 RepID=UPI00384E9619
MNAPEIYTSHPKRQIVQPVCGQLKIQYEWTHKNFVPVAPFPKGLARSDKNPIYRKQ